MEHHATDNDPIDCVHLGQTTVDLLFKDPICYGLFHAVRIRQLFTDGFQSIHGDGITAAPVRTICAVTHTNVSRGCITLASPLQLLPLLPEGAHDVAEFFVGQRYPERIAGQVVGLSRTRFCCFRHWISSCVSQICGNHRRSGSHDFSQESSNRSLGRLL